MDIRESIRLALGLQPYRRAIIEQNEYLERVVQERIIELEDQLARHLNGPETEPARIRAQPAIR